MTWLAVKTAIAKVWIWCKHNWKIVALVVYTALLYLLFSKNTRNAKKMLEDARAAHRAEIDALNKNHAEAIQKRDENLKKYQEVLKAIEEKLAEESKKIDAQKKERIKEIIEESENDLNRLSELIKEEFGFEIWESLNE